MPEITIDQQITAAKREVGMRRRVYSRWVENGKMKQAEADHQIAAMEAIVVTLEEVKKTKPGAQGAFL